MVVSANALNKYMEMTTNSKGKIFMFSPKSVCNYILIFISISFYCLKKCLFIVVFFIWSNIPVLYFIHDENKSTDDGNGIGGKTLNILAEDINLHGLMFIDNFYIWPLIFTRAEVFRILMRDVSKGVTMTLATQEVM
jgi:hypothetical protein